MNDYLSSPFQEEVDKTQYICSDHFGDTYLKQIIYHNATETYCSFCNETTRCISVKRMARFLEQRLASEYSQPSKLGIACYPNAGAYEDSFPGVNVEPAEEILIREAGVRDHTVAQEIVSFFEDHYFTPTYGYTDLDHFNESWEMFKKIIKHARRFTFSDLLSQSNTYDLSFNKIHDIFKEIRSICKQLNATKTFPERSLKIYRGRSHAQGEILSTAKSLGSPPSYFAKANRMSPAGISMFYGALTPETCIRELFSSSAPDDTATIGWFYNPMPLRLLDLSELPRIPSIFNKSERQQRNAVKFLINFIKDMSRPVIPDDRVHIEYVPTQIMTEHFRFSFEPLLDGIIYSSSRRRGEKCIVLFFGNEEMFEEEEIFDRPGLIYVRASATRYDHAFIAKVLYDHLV